MQDIAQPAVTAYLTVQGGLEAIALYQRAFGAELLTHNMADDGERVVHAALDVFGTMIMLSDKFPEYDADSKAPTSLGATTMAAMDAFWGMRYGRLKDPFGHAWAFGAPLPEKSEKAS